MTRASLLALIAVSGCIAAGPQPCKEGSGTPSSATVSGKATPSTTLTFTRDSSFDLFAPGFSADWSRMVTTDADGAFSFSLKSGEMKTSTGSSLSFGTRITDGQGSASYRFRVHASRVQPPELKLWKAELAAARDGAATKLSWSDLAAQQPLLEELSFSVRFLNGDELRVPPVWVGSVAGPVTSMSLADRLFEDFTNVFVRLSARSATCGDGSRFELAHQPTGQLQLDATNVAPVSRGATCTADVAGRGRPCPLTTGRLDYLALRDEFSPAPKQLTVDLGTSKSVRRAVLRDLTPQGANLVDEDGQKPDYQLVLESSVDGSTFTKIGETLHLLQTPGCADDAVGHTECWLDLDLGEPRPMRFFRLSMSQGFGSLTQVSLWE